MSLAMQRYETWRSQPGLDKTLSKELSAMEGDAEKILDSFGCDLAFGTAGLRGVLGAGTNRMNIYTVARATQGLASWLAGTSLPQKVASPTTAAWAARSFPKWQRRSLRQTA